MLQLLLVIKEDNMPQVDGLDAFGRPVIDLPTDFGDGPFFIASPSKVANTPKFAETEELFRRTEPFEDNSMTNMPVFGRSSHIMIGRFHVSDTLSPNTFRRVYQTVSYQPTADLEGNFEIRFTGAGKAIGRELSDALVPTLQSKSIASKPFRGNGPSSGASGNLVPKPLEGKGALSDAMDALEAGKMLFQPTMPAQSTTYQIRLRMPGYEPKGSYTTQSVEPRCILASSDEGRRLLSQNEIAVFSFGNSNGERKVFPITYPVGRSIPIVFDIISHVPMFAITVDLLVEVLIDRTKQNAEKESK